MLGTMKLQGKEVDFDNWMHTNQPESKYAWSGEWFEYCAFIRDRILPLFGSKFKIVGLHYSKSIVCPVIKTRYKGVDIIWQFNFYYWQIMVKSPFPIILTANELELYQVSSGYLFYQGIPNEYQFSPYLDTNNKKFALSCHSDGFIDIWAFALKLKSSIDEYCRNKGKH